MKQLKKSFDFQLKEKVATHEAVHTIKYVLNHGLFIL